MDPESLIRSYGYAALAVGTFLEGETILVAAAFAAHRGYLELPLVLAVATVCGFVGDQCFFWLGRHHADVLERRFPSLVPRVARVRALLETYSSALIVAVRFMYGLRIAGPIAIGMSRVDWRRFLLFNLLGAVIWALAIGGLGYAFGAALERLLDDLKRYELLVLSGIVIAGALWWLLRRSMRRRP